MITVTGQRLLQKHTKGAPLPQLPSSSNAFSIILGTSRFGFTNGLRRCCLHGSVTAGRIYPRTAGIKVVKEDEGSGAANVRYRPVPLPSWVLPKGGLALVSCRCRIVCKMDVGRQNPMRLLHEEGRKGGERSTRHHI